MKALVNVLKHWGYPVSWRDACDARGKLNMVIVSKEASSLDRMFRGFQTRRELVAPRDQIEYCVHCDDIKEVVGGPKKFKVILSGVTWQFDWKRGDLVVKDE